MTDAQQKWLVKLMGYDFSIEYKKGKENSVADALSRQMEGALHALSLPVPRWIEPIQKEVQQDSDLQEIFKRIQDDEAVGPWRFHSGVIFFKDRIYLKATSPLTQAILAEFHNSAHEGYQKGLQRIKSVFYWQGMKLQLKTFIQQCEVCQRHKAVNTKPAGLLQPLPIPSHIWTDISMDFIDGLPLSFGKTTIFVVVDRFSKYGHFTAIKNPYTAPQVAQVFFAEIFRLHSLPSSMCVTETPLSLVSFGVNCSISMVSNSGLALHITRRQMAKRKW